MAPFADEPSSGGIAARGGLPAPGAAPVAVAAVCGFTGDVSDFGMDVIGIRDR